VTCVERRAKIPSYVLESGESGEGMNLELEAWRIVSRPARIEEVLERLAPLIARHVPVDLAVVRRIDVANSRLETAGAACWGAGVLPRRARTPLPPPALERLMTWLATGEILQHAGAEDESWPASMLPAGIRGAFLAGALVGATGPSGVLLLVAARGASFSRPHVSAARELLAPLAAALETDRLFHETSSLREAAHADRQARREPQDISESIVGAETGLREVMERVELVAHTDAPVLILGETGSGKEVVARALHSRSRRAAGPVLRVNCGAIPADLVDSELFGHERGSFTGAVAERKGWFERADGGTLFLDEIGELPLSAQVRLLRVLQDGSFERVGGQRSLMVDVRIVAATHRDLPSMVRERRFREDLYYRIGVFPIRLPPLRERREDIPALAGHFARRAGMRLGASPLLPTGEDVDLLLAYDWPGNARELAAVIERAAILGNGRRLEVAKALGVAAPARAPEPAARSVPPAADEVGPFPTLDAAMARHVEAALERTAGRIEGPHGAAVLLGINPHTLRARMRKLEVNWRRFRSPGRKK
jgi:hydrogenase-4 transcriptional activator